jgi:lipid II:glycine glycyltransferase (peptidoglycan interpeptide bridge formation enzyme)
MEIIRLDNQKDNKEIDHLAGGEFLQSVFWGELSVKGGEIIERWGVKNGEKLLAAATIIKKSLIGPFFYWYAPRGPRGDKKAIDFLLNELKDKKSGAVFFRLEPEELPSDEKIKNNLKKSVDLQPKKTLLLDLNKSEEELLKLMGQKTRYNIRLAEKKGVKITLGTVKYFSEFWRLMSLTGERDAFRLHDVEHYKNLISADENFVSNSDGQIKLFFARANGKNIATGLFCFFGDRVTYMHGASDNEARNLMSPHLLQWEVIKQAQKDGYKYYDFYGIDEKKWPGVTRFKLGFGGFVKEYPGTYDFIFRPGIYSLYEFLRKLRRSLK